MRDAAWRDADGRGDDMQAQEDRQATGRRHADEHTAGTIDNALLMKEL